MDGRVKPGHDGTERIVGEEKNKPKKAKPPKSKGSKSTKLRPIGLDAGKIVIHDSSFDPLPDEFMKAFE